MRKGKSFEGIQEIENIELEVWVFIFCNGFSVFWFLCF